MSEKTIGYLLIVAGLISIIFSAISVITVFTGTTQPAEIFHFEGIGLDASALIGGDMPEEQAALARQMVSGQKMELISEDLLNDTSNLFAHFFLMGFISTVGYKVASLGTMMVRPIQVTVREASPKPYK